MNESKYSGIAALKWLGALAVAAWIKTPDPIRILTLLLIVDYATGVAAAARKKELCSEEGWNGLVRKCGTLAFVWLLYGAQIYVTRSLSADATSLPYWAQVPAANAMAMGYVCNELISVIENFAKMGVAIPAPLIAALASAKRFRVRPATPEQIEELGRE